MAERTTGTADAILDVAEHMARRGGYGSFSFREIAKAVGIKAASVHYHFPSKDDLGAAVARRYTERFLDQLGPPDGDDPALLLERYVDAYRRALLGDELMCLCGLLGAEIAGLPEPVAMAARDFFARNLAWLEAVFARVPGVDHDQRRAQSAHLIAALEGALILARTLGEPDLFEQVAASLDRASSTRP